MPQNPHKPLLYNIVGELYKVQIVSSSDKFYAVTDGVQDTPLQNMVLWHITYFKLKGSEKTPSIVLLP